MSLFVLAIPFLAAAIDFGMPVSAEKVGEQVAVCEYLEHDSKMEYVEDYFLWKKSPLSPKPGQVRKVKCVKPKTLK